MDHFYLPLSKTTDAEMLFDKIHNAIHQDNNEVKTDRFDDSKITQVILYLLNTNEMYYNHIRILMIPIRIKNRCTIEYTDNHQECIFLIPDYVNDPENININEIEDLSYVVIKHKFSEAMKIVLRMRSIDNPVRETVPKSDDEKYPETTPITVIGV
jgi:GH15 family glucan-1,4-alpha-glucosidase